MGVRGMNVIRTAGRVLALLSVVAALLPAVSGNAAPLRPQITERFAIVRAGVGLEQTWKYTRGTAGDCVNGALVEVIVSVGTGAAGTVVKGKAKCGRLAVVSPFSVADPGTGTWASAMNSGNQTGGNATCGFSYEAAGGPSSTWMVVCRFY